MTTELEQEFFRAFGIEPKNKCGKNLIYPNCLNPDKCGYDNCIYYQIEYPDITAEKLLEMICIAMKYKNTYRFVNGIEDLKEQTLKILISIKDMLSIYAEIQQLFKEGE